MGFLHKDKDGGHSAASGQQALARVVKVTPEKSHGGHTTWRFITLVTPDDGSHFGSMFTDILPDSIGFPGEWKRVPVVFNPRDHNKISIDQSRLGEVDLTEPWRPQIVINGVAVDSGPKWVVPHQCPNCGAVVDQAAQGMAAEPMCMFCHQPLPVEAAPAGPGLGAAPGSTLGAGTIDAKALFRQMPSN